MRHIIRIILFTLAIVAMPNNSWSQNKSAANSKYEQGVALAKEGQKGAAEKCFEASMKLDGSKANKERCRNAIKNLYAAPVPTQPVSQGSGSQSVRYGSDSPEQVQPPITTLSLPEERVRFDGNGGTYRLNVAVTPVGSYWDVSVRSENMQMWCSAAKSDDGQAINIVCKHAIQTIPRMAKFLVAAGDTKKEIFITQNGKPVTLSCKKEKQLQQTFNKNGGKSTINILCNSDTIYNNGGQQCNWRINTMPTWCKGMCLRTSVTAYATTKAKIPTADLVIEVEPNTTGASRSGVVVIESQRQTLEVTISQKK